MTKETIIVANSFGKDKPVTADDFTNRWVSLIDQMMYLVETPADLNDLKQARVSVATMARRKFNRLLQAQKNRE